MDIYAFWIEVELKEQTLVWNGEKFIPANEDEPRQTKGIKLYFSQDAVCSA